MSVAFRRESDEEHKEPKFELPLPPGPNLVTERGLTLIGDRITALETDLAAEQDEEQREQLRRELRYWNTRRATAQIAPVPEEGEVGIGSRVTFVLAGKKRAIDIVGHDEADPEAGRIAFSAPLALAMMGAAEGERVDFGGKAEAIEVVKVEAIPE